MSGFELCAWLHELAQQGAERLPVDRETFAALLADKHVTWTPHTPTLTMFDLAADGQQVANVCGVPMVKSDDG